MKHRKLKIFLIVAASVLVVIAGITFYFYQQGGKEHYVPPVAKHETPVEQAITDLETLSKAIEAYNSLNLKYPERLDELQPDFVTKVPVDPATGKAYTYLTEGASKYKISVPNPAAYNQKVLAIENGKLTKE